MPLVPMKEILQKAHRHGYAVGAFNVVNPEFPEAIIETAAAKESPVILNIAEVHFPFVNLETICPAISALASRTSIPVALNLDHGVSFEAIVRALRNGFSSVMFDGSKSGFEENIAGTAEVVRMCHAVGVSVEAELGAVGGDEGGGLESQADAAFFTDPAQAGAFVQQTGIDALAVAIGNAHGKYKSKPKLDFARLAAINDAVGIPLVLHGGSGISPADFKKAISLGIAKINIYTDMSQAALKTTHAYLNQSETHYHAFPHLMQGVKKAVSIVVEKQIDIFGSAQKA